MQRVKDQLEPLLGEIKEVERLLEKNLEIGDGDLTKTLFIKKIGIYIEVCYNTVDYVSISLMVLFLIDPIQNWQ